MVVNNNNCLLLTFILVTENKLNNENDFSFSGGHSGHPKNPNDGRYKISIIDPVSNIAGEYSIIRSLPKSILCSLY